MRTMVADTPTTCMLCTRNTVKNKSLCGKSVFC